VQGRKPCRREIFSRAQWRFIVKTCCRAGVWARCAVRCCRNAYSADLPTRSTDEARARSAGLCRISRHCRRRPPGRSHSTDRFLSPSRARDNHWPSTNTTFQLPAIWFLLRDFQRPRRETIGRIASARERIVCEGAVSQRVELYLICLALRVGRHVIHWWTTTRRMR
jgi:hypothetical protein